MCVSMSVCVRVCVPHQSAPVRRAKRRLSHRDKVCYCQSWRRLREPATPNNEKYHSALGRTLRAAWHDAWRERKDVERGQSQLMWERSCKGQGQMGVLKRNNFSIETFKNISRQQKVKICLKKGFWPKKSNQKVVL